MRATTKLSGFARLGALAMCICAAACAFAIALPSNAHAFSTSYDGDSDTFTYELTNGDKVDLEDRHTDASRVIIHVDGTATINSDITVGGTLVIYPASPAAYTTCKLNINGAIYAKTMYIGDQITGSRLLTLNVKCKKVNKSFDYAALDCRDLYISGSNTTVTANAGYGIRVAHEMRVGRSTINATAASYTNGISTGIEVGGNTDESEFEAWGNSTVNGTGLYNGISCVSLNVYDTSVVKGKATKKTTATSSKRVYGAKVNYAYLNGGTLKGYAYAPVKSLSKTNAYSAGIMAGQIDSVAGTVYASNSGKYGWGLGAVTLYNFENEGAGTTLNAYAKNYGIGMLTYGLADLDHVNGTVYGGKYAIYARAEFSVTNATLKAYGKNAKGTRTGNGIYVNSGNLYISNSKVTAYAKKSSSYYGICVYSLSSNPPMELVAMNNSVVNVSAYSSKAFCTKHGTAVTKGKVGKTCTLKVNGKVQTSYPGLPE